MSIQIDPKIVAKLRQFAARRRKLIILRGVCTGVAMLLATMTLVALIDSLFVLPDAVRWGLSAAAYLAVILAEWRTCLRLLAHTPGPRKLARLLEHAEPGLREDLISAVELGTADDTAIFDSSQFRELVQKDVAARVETLQVERLLPVNLVRRYLVLTVCIVVALLATFAITGSQFGTLLARALLPMANLARVSKFKIAIVEPQPAEMQVPHGDTVPLLIQVSGGRTNKAILEVFTQATGREVVTMTPVAEGRFSATIQVGREDLDYRVRAGDAITKKYRFEAEARPHVVRFEKAYTYPAYSRIERKIAVEEHGDLRALEGTEVELRLQTNQIIKSGELRVEQGKKQYNVPLQSSEGRHVAKLPMDVSGTYRVHLIGDATGFENKFSPEYEIRVDPDLVPKVELESPKHDLILPANEIVDLEGTASDDQALAGVWQVISINDGPWQEVPLTESAAATATVERRWDLYEQGAKPGNLIATKFMARDLKGNKGESRTLQVTVTDAGFELKRLQTVELQRRVHTALRALRTAGEALAKQANEAREQFERLGENDPQRKQPIIRAVAAAEEFESKVVEAWTEFTVVLPQVPPGHVSADLVLLGRLLGRANAGTAQLGRDALELAARDPAASMAREQMNEFAETSGRAWQRLQLAEQAMRTFLAAEELDVVTENTHVVAREQERLTALAENSGGDAKKWAQLANRVRVVIAETRSLEAMLTTAASHNENGGLADRLRRLQKDLEKQRAGVEAGLTGAPDRRLMKSMAELAKACAESSRRLLEIERDMSPLPVRVVTEVGREVQPTYASFEKLRQDLQMVAVNEKLPGEARTYLMRRRYEARGALLQQHGDLEEMRPDSDTYFVSDVRAASRAFEALRESIAAPDTGFAKLSVIDKNFRLLESAHNLFEVADGLAQLAAAERWEIYDPRARTTAPRDWEWLEGRLKSLPDELDRTQLDEPLRKLIAQAQKIVADAPRDPAARIVNQEMKDRFKAERDPVAVQAHVERIAGLVKQALELLRTPMDEARATLAEMAPKLHEMMAQLAKEAEELKKETSEEAVAAETAPPDQTRTAAEQSLAKQQQLSAKVGILKDALRSDANKQDVMQPEGRERARDADDALAMLREPPPRAEQALQEATQATQAPEQKQALNAASEQQQKLAEALRELAQHYENAEHGKAGETRIALRATEQESGVKAQLDAQYAKAEQMAQLAQKTPEELLAQLEKALPENPAMQKELSEVAKNALTGAEQKLAQASQQENQVAQEIAKMAAEEKTQMAQAQAARIADALLGPPAPAPAASSASPPPSAVSPRNAEPQIGPPNPQLAKVASQQAPIAQSTKQAGQEVSRAGRHEERLQHSNTGEQLQQLGDEIQETAMQDVPGAEKALAAALAATQVQQPVEAAKTELAADLARLQAAANPRTPQQEEATPAAPPGRSPGAAQPSSEAQTGQQVAGTPATPAMPLQPGSTAPSPATPSPFGQLASTGEVTAPPPTPREQVWMARALDALDAALHGETPPSGQAPPPGSSQAASPTPSSSPAQTLAQAQSAMAAAAQAAAAAMRAERGESKSATPGEAPATSGMQAKSTAGIRTNGIGEPYSSPGTVIGVLKNGDWGKLPKKVAEELTQAQRESVPGEYRNQIETYYRVIAEKSKKP